MRFLIGLFFLLGACSQHKENHNNHDTHTHKLIRPLAIAFLSKNEVIVKVGDSKLKSLSLKVYHQLENSKSLVFEGPVEGTDGPILLALQDEIAEKGGVLAAVVSGLDSNNKALSASASYVLGEQDEIDSVKNIMLKN
jgi:hypothetical protein